MLVVVTRAMDAVVGPVATPKFSALVQEARSASAQHGNTTSAPDEGGEDPFEILVGVRQTYEVRGCGGMDGLDRHARWFVGQSEADVFEQGKQARRRSTETSPAGSLQSSRAAGNAAALNARKMLRHSETDLSRKYVLNTMPTTSYVPHLRLSSMSALRSAMHAVKALFNCRAHSSSLLLATLDVLATVASPATAAATFWLAFSVLPSLASSAASSACTASQRRLRHRNAQQRQRPPSGRERGKVAKERGDGGIVRVECVGESIGARLALRIGRGGAGRRRGRMRGRRRRESRGAAHTSPPRATQGSRYTCAALP
ncbi:hypothetical protein L1887_50605 [Cichorium endivia]|nr:hypothetical protein L1887_50605 [Cichorium endivia]